MSENEELSAVCSFSHLTNFQDNLPPAIKELVARAKRLASQHIMHEKYVSIKSQKEHSGEQSLARVLPISKVVYY